MRTSKSLLSICSVKEEMGVTSEQMGESQQRIGSNKKSRIEIIELKNVISEILEIY